MKVLIETKKDLQLLKEKFPPAIGGNIYLHKIEAYNGVKAVVSFDLVKQEFFVKFNYPHGMCEGDWEDGYAKELLEKLKDNEIFLDILIEEGLTIKIEKGTSKNTFWYSWKVEIPQKAKNIIKNRFE